MRCVQHTCLLSPWSCSDSAAVLPGGNCRLQARAGRRPSGHFPGAGVGTSLSGARRLRQSRGRLIEERSAGRRQLFLAWRRLCGSRRQREGSCHAIKGVRRGIPRFCRLRCQPVLLFPAHRPVLPAIDAALPQVTGCSAGHRLGTSREWRNRFCAKPTVRAGFKSADNLLPGPKSG
jgi:hypothetical protein